MKQHFISERVPYAHFLDDGVLRLRNGGTTVGFEIHGPGHETTSAAEVLTACERFASSLTHFGTGDFVQVISHRVPATKYRRQEFTNRASALIDRERAEQFEGARYFRTLTRLYISNQDESAIANQLKALFFASSAHQMRGSRELQMQRFFQRISKWEDVIVSTFHPRRLSTSEVFRDLILCVNGTDYETVLPRPGAPLHQIVGQQDLFGGSTPRIGQLHVRPVTLVYPWPKETTQQALAVLLTHAGELMLSCRFVCLDQVDAAYVAKLDRKHFVREANGTGIKQWIINAFGLKKRATADQDLEEQIAEIDQALADISSGMPYGWATITALVRGPGEEEVNSRARQLVKDLAAIQHGTWAGSKGGAINDAAVALVIRLHRSRSAILYRVGKVIKQRREFVSGHLGEARHRIFGRRFRNCLTGPQIFREEFAGLKEFLRGPPCLADRSIVIIAGSVRLERAVGSGPQPKSGAAVDHVDTE